MKGFIEGAQPFPLNFCIWALMAPLYTKSAESVLAKIMSVM